MQVEWPPLLVKMTDLTGLPGSGFAGTDNFGRTLGFCGHRKKSRERLCFTYFIRTQASKICASKQASKQDLEKARKKESKKFLFYINIVFIIIIIIP